MLRTHIRGVFSVHVESVQHVLSNEQKFICDLCWGHTYVVQMSGGGNFFLNEGDKGLPTPRHTCAHIYFTVMILPAENLEYCLMLDKNFFLLPTICQ